MNIKRIKENKTDSTLKLQIRLCMEFCQAVCIPSLFERNKNLFKTMPSCPFLSIKISLVITFQTKKVISMLKNDTATLFLLIWRLNSTQKNNSYPFWYSFCPLRYSLSIYFTLSPSFLDRNEGHNQRATCFIFFCNMVKLYRLLEGFTHLICYCTFDTATQQKKCEAFWCQKRAPTNKIKAL